MMESKSRRRKMRQSKRSSAIVTLTALSVLTVAISAHQQHPQSAANTTEFQSSSTELHRQLEPRRKPQNVDHAKRMNALPPMLTKSNEINIIPQKQTPPIKKKQSPYYPSIKTGTCLNDNKYPDYFLYDVKSYFFHSAKECCERHFGNSVGTKGGGMLKDGGVGKCLAAVIVGEGMIGDSVKKVIPGMKTAGVEHHAMFNAAKTGKMPGVSDVMPPIMYAESSIGAGKSDKLSEHPGKMFHEPPMHWSSSTGSAVKGDMDGEKGLDPSGKKMPPKMYPKPPYIYTAMGKSGKSEEMPGSSWNPDAKLPFKPPEMNQMPDLPSWGPDSKTSKLPSMEMMPPSDSHDISSKYTMPPKRPPPPELNGSQYWNLGWNQLPQHPHSKSGKAKSHKSAKSKSGKSKASKAKAGAPWWGSDEDYTYSPTYMPTESDDAFQIGWMGGGENSQGQQNNRPNAGGKPNSPMQRPVWAGGSTNAGGKPGNVKPNNNWMGFKPMPRPQQSKPDNWSGDNSGKPMKPPPVKPWSGWNESDKPEKPNPWGNSSKPHTGSKPSWGGAGKPGGGSQGGYWGSWGDNNKPGWNGSGKPEKPNWWGSWQRPVPVWGNSWSSGGWAGGNEWGQGWEGSWGGWGEPKPSSKPSMSTPTAKPTGLFPSDTLAPSGSPSDRMPTYSPSNPWPTYSPTQAGDTYSPTPSSSTYAPSPSVSSYAPSPSSTSYEPTALDSPTMNPTFVPTNDSGTPSPHGEDSIPTFSPSVTPTEEGQSAMPTDLESSPTLCVWGSAYSSGQENEGEMITVPLTTDLAGVHVSAGSKYSFIVDSNGVAMAAGHIEDLDSYHGHLGIQPEDLSKGTNEFQAISKVFDEDEGKEVDPPLFEKVFAGVENSPDSGIVHTILMDRNGNAYAMGSNSKGQLCLQDESDRLIPTMIRIEGVRIVDVAIGAEHTLLLDEDGNVFGCGSNEMGQLGLPSSTVKTDTPLKIYTLPLVSSVSSGRDHSLFIADDGVYVSGDNTYGQLCVDTDSQPLFEPQALDIPFDIITSFEAIFSSSYILFSDGSVIGCGDNHVGQLGNGEEKESDTFEPTVVETEGLVIGLLGAGPSAKSVFFITDNEVYGTGLNTNGQLGVGDTENRNVPTLVGFGSEVKINLLSAGEDHTLASCPPSLEGFPTFSPTPSGNETEPTMSPSYGASENATYIPTSGSYAPTPTASSYTPTTYAPTSQGFNFFFWGNPESIGQESDENVTQPLTIDGDVAYASAGSKYSVIVMMDGSALSSGVVEPIDDYSGHLGIGEDSLLEGVNALQIIANVTDTNETMVDAPAFSMVFAGVESTPGSGIIHTILLDRDGNVYATGSNNRGQLCLGDEDERLIPSQIDIEGPIVDVAIGAEHTLLLHENGTVYVCGSNEVGQIGLGEDVDQTSSPVTLDAISSISSVSAGAHHSLLMASDGIFVMGDNSYGQLCFNETDFLRDPNMLDIPIKNIVSFEAIRSSSYILYIDGSINACGRNDLGQLGDGTFDNKILTEVVMNAAVRSIFTGPSSESVFFITEDETMFGTGSNSWGNLGVGDQKDRSIPARVQFEEQVLTTALSPSDDHTIAFGLVTGSLPPSASPTPAPTDIITPSPTLGLITGTITPTAAPTLSSSTLVPSEAPTMSPSRLTESPSKTPSSTPSYPPTIVAATKLPTFSPTAGVSAISTTSPTTEAETTDLFAWGAQESVGLPTGESTAPESLAKPVIDISAGSKYSLILMSDGTAQSAGYIDSKDDYHGHLGLKGSDVKEGSNQFQDISTVYDNEEIISSPPFTKVFAGVEEEDAPGSIHSFLIDDMGQAWAFGSNANGELCLGDDIDRLIPTKVAVDGKVISVAIGAKHTLILLDDGNVYACGSNEDGELALGESAEAIVNTPTKVEDVQEVKMVSAGLGSSLFLASDGVYVSGANSFGQLCVDTNTGSLFEPTLLEGVNAGDIAAFQAIRTSSYILFNDGSVGACGRNNFGQLADGTNDDNTRVVVKETGSSSGQIPIRRLGVGPSSDSVFFVSDNGSLYATGLNDRGQLGVGDTNNRNELTLVEYSGDFLSNQQLSASSDHTLSR